ncbi:hypothetical protein BH09BAC6_BH09BAC6_09120 [soil metagenome]|jgi:hypothetical protein
MKHPKLFMLLYLLSTVFSTTLFAQNEQIKVMVMPFVKQGEDLRTKMVSDFDLQELISKIKSGFENKGFKIQDFEATLKEAETKKALKLNTPSALKTALIKYAEVDVYVEVEINIVTTGGGKKARVLLTAYDAVTANPYTRITCDSREHNGADNGTLTILSLQNTVLPTNSDDENRSKAPCLDEFIATLQTKLASYAQAKASPPVMSAPVKTDLRGVNVVAAPKKQIGGGKYYALVIGVQNYKDHAIPSLEGPLGDADKLANVLSTVYTFNSENVSILKNPTRLQFFDAMESILNKLTEDDNFLLFYAGHGNWDESRREGYWYPADAVLNQRGSWITNADLLGYFKGIKARHTLLITDACFSGSIFNERSIEAARPDMQELYNLPSRKAMTSGGKKTVPDKSVFIEYLVKRLADNADQFLSSEQLFSRFRGAVTNNSSNRQVPQFGVIHECGDEGGDFIFEKRKQN